MKPIRNGTITKRYVSADIMRNGYFYATFKCEMECVVVSDGRYSFDTSKFLDALYSRYPSVKHNNKCQIIFN